ncbi:MAG: DedA family protein [Xanthobacteraceae bacterium]|nr:DedA family protein [Xanthobacteraceae bacterium]QYK44756.1 MAG: DedA family protein [Xanthobacteraceae bacterium]HMN50895.1 YqaA family protein [Xanthobacteraceae bacterium]
MLRRMYNWVLALSGRPSAPWALGAVSFAESSVFPIPPDVMLIPMCLAKPKRAFFYAGLCTITSVLGGLVGYAIGALLYESVGKWLIQLYGYGTQSEAFRQAYAEWGHWVILIKGVTPIPYKLVTITAGFAEYNLFWFVVLSLITRGLRFYLVAGLLYWMGPPAKEFIEKRLELIFVIFLIIFVLGFIAAIYVF